MERKKLQNEKDTWMYMEGWVEQDDDHTGKKEEGKQQRDTIQIDSLEKSTEGIDDNDVVFFPIHFSTLSYSLDDKLWNYGW